MDFLDQNDWADFISLLRQYQTADDMRLFCKTKVFLPSYTMPFKRTWSLFESDSITSTFVPSKSNYVQRYPYTTLLTQHQEIFFLLLLLRGVSYGLQERHFSHRGQ